MKPNLTQNQIPKKIFWAIDPFHEAPKEQLRAAKAIQFLFQGTNISVTPISMLLSGRYDPEERTFLEEWPELADHAYKNLQKLFKDVKLQGLERPRLERQMGSSVSYSVQGLIDFAMEDSADFIVVSSHARKGTVRLLLGSFAETLVLKSPIPVLVVNPKVNPTAKLKNILFPTDFSERSKEAFDEILLIAKRLDCKILLFHKVQYLYPSFGYPFVVPPVSEESMREYAIRYRQVAEEWVQEGRSRGILVKAHVCGKSGYAVDEITKTAKKLGSSGIIAMASQSGRFTSMLLGSLTRQVLRNAPCPVLVIHPEHKSGVGNTVEEIKRAAIEFGQHPLMT